MTNDGGAAFPVNHVHPQWTFTPENKQKFMEGFQGKEGMSLRDYFAAKAMQGIATSTSNGWVGGLGLGHVAELAYQLADAMLTQREKGERG